MRFSYNWLKEYINIKQKPKELAELLTMRSFEALVASERDGDAILNIDVLPNRAHDCLSHYGIAKEVGVLTNQKIRPPEDVFKEEKSLKTPDFVSVKIENAEKSPRYMARILKDIKIISSPKWLQAKLAAFSVNSHNIVVDILNYAMLETGQPLHAFDFDKLTTNDRQQTTKQIIVRQAKKGEQIKTLDGTVFYLNENILVIADAKNPIAIAGIKGGLDSGIDKNTKTIILESANFDSATIRRGAKSLEIMSDAAIRFSQGLDPNLAEHGMNRACFLLQKITGAKIAKSAADIYPKKVMPRAIKLDPKYVKSLTGVDFGSSEIKKILEKVGFVVKKGPQNSFLVKVPTIRLDLERPEDLIEEIVRLYGYDNIKSKQPLAAILIPQTNILNNTVNNIRGSLAAIGFSETYNYSFVSKSDWGAFDMNPDWIWELQNPVSSQYQYLRNTLIIGLLKNTISNFRFQDKVKLFEVGKIFKKHLGVQNGETLRGTAIIAQKNYKENQKGDLFYEIKGVLDSILSSMGLFDVSYDEGLKYDESRVESYWHPARVAVVRSEKRILGVVGELNHTVLSRFDFPGRCAAFSFNIEELSNADLEVREFSPLPKYPAVVRDLSLLVDRRVRIEEVLNVIYGAGADLIEDADLFDIFENENLPESKKSLTFRIIYQADHTLTNTEVGAEENKIKKALVDQLGAEIR